MSFEISTAGQNKKKLSIVFSLTAIYMMVEVVGGFLTNSLALLADAGHMFADVAALGLVLLAIWFAERPATVRKTYGYYRVEILAAFVNAIVLLFISGYILYEAWRRFQFPPEVQSAPMLAVAGIGLVVNLIGVWFLHGGSEKSLNIKGAYLEVLSDLLGSIGVILASVIMLTTRWYLADPIISAGIGLFILPRTWALLNEAIHILLEGTPAHIDLKSVEDAMKQVKGIKAIHDLHIWTITSGIDALSAHITVEDSTQCDRTLSELEKILKDQFNIDHTTIQLEGERCQDKGMPI